MSRNASDAVTTLVTARHYHALDGLRGAAVLLVVAGHAGLTPGMPAGAVGVTVFFVLSGFLITGIITRARESGSWSFREFFGNRLARLFPALIVMELVIGAWWLLDGRSIALFTEYAAAATFYYENFMYVLHDREVLSHTWSLSVEEQFYLLWPFVLPLALRSRRWAWGVIVGLAVTSVALRIIAVGFLPVGHAYANIATNAYALLIGCGISLLYTGSSKRTERKSLVLLLGVGILLVIAAGRLIPNPNIFAPIIAALISGALVIALLPGSSLLEWAPLRFVGRISYALYLWHWPLLVMTGTLEDQVRSLPVIFVSVIVAIISTLYIEEPLRRIWRARRMSGKQGYSFER